MREEFEKWARGNDFSLFRADHDYSVYLELTTAVAWEAWQARQPEIDALKAEVDRLRKEIEPSSLFLLAMSSSTSVSPAFQKIALRHHEAIDAAMKETK